MRLGPQHPLQADALVAPPGYRVEPLITGLTFPTAVSFGPGGEIYLAERGGVQHLQVALPRILRIDPDRSVIEIGRLEHPIVGLAYRNAELMIAEDGPAPRVLRVTAEGHLQNLVQELPGGGDYGLSGLTLDGSGSLLFGLGTRTNSGVVGLDNAARGWVAGHPDWADVPGADGALEGVNYVTTGPGGVRSSTGGFKPFRRRSEPGEAVRGSRLCGGALYRLPVEGGEVERLCTGLRNPVGMAVSPDGRLFATEAGMEERGSRPIAGAPDNLWEIRPGAHYGWPDYASGLSVTESRFRLPGHPQPRPLLSSSESPGVRPAAMFPTRSGIGGLDFSSSHVFGHIGEAFVALSGEWTAGAYPNGAATEGHKIVRVNLRTGEIVDFLSNRSGVPAPGGITGGLERPVEVRFDPSGDILYVVDLGVVTLDPEQGLLPYGGTGVIWRITRTRALLTVPDLPADGGGAREAPPEHALDDDDPFVLPDEDDAADDFPIAPEPIADEPAVDEPAADQPARDEPAGDEAPAPVLQEEAPTTDAPGGEPAGSGEAEPAWEESAGASDAHDAAPEPPVGNTEEDSAPVPDEPVPAVVAAEDDTPLMTADAEVGDPGADAADLPNAERTI